MPSILDPNVTTERSLLGGFFDNARAHGGAPALLWRGKAVRYDELAAMAVQAHEVIRALRLEDDEPLGIAAKKSPAAIATVLACLMARRPFLLPSADLGDVALAALFEKARCRHVLAPGPELGGTVRLELTGGRALDEATDVALPEPDAISFMLTTSGSTGIPKIVPLSVGAIDRFTTWAGDAFALGPGAVVLNHAPLNFDLCLLDIWATLKLGGCVALVDQDQAMNTRYLLDLFAFAKPTVVQAVPGLYRLLLEAAGGPSFASVEHAIFTGEAIAANVLAALPKLLPNARLYNVYGCTETNDSFIAEVDPSAIDREASLGNEGPLSIGEPLPGVDALLVADDGSVIEGPGTGELWVSTPFQTRGYLGGAGAEKFVTRPGDLDRTWYRSGDLVHRGESGRLTLRGRNDFQVKVRGVRVNLEEVEQILLEHEAVAEAAAVAVADPAAGNQLRALVRLARPRGINTLELRAHCSRRLPRPAIPSTFRFSEEPLPRTVTNKIDRRGVKRLLEGEIR